VTETIEPFPLCGTCDRARECSASGDCHVASAAMLLTRLGRPVEYEEVPNSPFLREIRPKKVTLG
jgi:hypothetical protein